MNKFNKKAFTLMEMLISVVCIGLLTIALSAFTMSINNHTQKLRNQEEHLLNEFSDVSRLEHEDITAEFIDTLNHPEFLHTAAHLVLGEMHSSSIEADDVKTMTFESADENIVTVDNMGTCFPVKPGVTFIKINIVFTDDTSTTTYYPVVVSPDEEYSYVYYLYAGKEYFAWFMKEV